MLVRVHTECLTGDVFDSLRCDCGAQLEPALDAIAAEGGRPPLHGQEGRGIGLINKLRAYSCRSRGSTPSKPTALGFPADTRDYGTAPRSSPTSASQRCGC